MEKECSIRRYVELCQVFQKSTTPPPSLSSLQSKTEIPMKEICVYKQ